MNNIYIYTSDDYSDYKAVSSVPNLTVIFKGDGNSIFLSPSFKIKGKMRIVCSNNQKVVIKNNCWAESPLLYMNGNNNCLEIGEHTSFRNLIINFGNEENLLCSIGKDCMFGGGCTIRVSDAHTIIDITSKEIINRPTGVKIGNHVWIAQNVFIAKNVTIPNNCIVGAHSVVTRKFEEPNSIIAGVPAKVVKNNINWSRKCIRQYEEK